MFDHSNKNSLFRAGKLLIFTTSFFAFQSPGNAQVVELNVANVSALCSNVSGGADAFYQVTLKSDFKGGIVSRTMVQDFFPGVVKPRIDDGPKLLVRSVAGKHNQILPATAYKVRGVFTAIRTSPRAAIGVVPVPQVEFPCNPRPTPSDNGNGNNAGDPNFRCPNGQQPWGVNGACIYSGASLPYSPNQLIASSSHTQLNGQPQNLADRTLDVIEWKGVRWQVDYTNN
jgi:hypothetical protein